MDPEEMPAFRVRTRLDEGGDVAAEERGLGVVDLVRGVDVVDRE
jgi:hypothetical protein